MSEPTGEGPSPVLAVPAAAIRRAAHVVLAWIRERLSTTPGRLTLASFAVVVAALVLGTVALTAERSRETAAQAVASETEPLLLGAVKLYASLSHADATATTTFLTGGLEPPGRRATYVGDISTASAELATLGRRSATSPTTQRAVATITEQLPVYTGLVEAARANNLQGLPVGAAYQRKASGLLAATILPAADRLYQTAATRLNADYRSGGAAATLIAFAAAVLASLALLLVIQLYLTRISRRILNIPLLGATAALAVLAVWGVVGLIGEKSALARAQRSGSDSVELLSATQILASRAQSDESLALVARGGDTSPFADFDAVMRALTPAGGGGLLAEVTAQAQRTDTGPAATELATTLAAYRAQHARIVRLVSGGRFADAVALEVSSAATGSSPADRLSRNLSAQITAAQARFVDDAQAATAAFGGLAVATPLLSVLAAALALIGLRERINEYR